MKKTGIVILNYNGSSFLELTLDSLLRAKTNCAFEVGVIDNGSEKNDADNAQRITDKYLAKGLKGFFIRSEKNLGFSGGNNVVIKRFLEDSEITNICMLNSDVIVTDYWLDYLTEKDYDAVGPVTNATGNEQTVSVDYEVKPNQAAFKLANQFAKYRHETFKGLEFETSILYFFNTIISRRVIEKIGFLDERFYPGSFEDGDYCLRMKKAGFHQMIVRGCYVHHFGSGSFSKLEMSNRINISNVNRRRFEEKWNMKWESDTWKLLLSCQEDMEQFENKTIDSRSAKLLKKSLEETQQLIRSWADGIEWFQSEQYIDQKIAERKASDLQQQDKLENCEKDTELKQTENKETAVFPQAYAVQYSNISELNGKRLLWLIWKKAQMRFYKLVSPEKHEELWKKSCYIDGIKYPLVPLGNTSAREALKLAVHKFLVKIKLSKENPPQEQSALLTENEQVECLVEEITQQIGKIERKVVVHAPIFTKENERDGYFQRIKRIDETIFLGFLRIYVFEDGKKDEQLKITKINNMCYFVRYNSHDEKQRAQIFEWTKAVGIQYIHSINRFMLDSVNVEMCQLLNSEQIKTIWDVHGSVPEEYEMYGNDVGKQIADEVEHFFFNYADVIVVVNRATEEHLRKKHGETKARFVVLPIFNVDSKSVSSEAFIPRINNDTTIVYCGGVQKWQNVELMQSIIRQTEGKYKYHILVPSPEAFNAYWGEKAPSGIIVESKAPEELNEVYSKCQYGFVLRDDSVVNRVACPTKILEYIVNGVVPIFKSQYIGDFVSLGLEYVDYKDMLNGKMPSEEERVEMAKKNMQILAKLDEAYLTGIAKVKQEISTQFSKAEPVIGIVVTTFDKGGLEQVVLNLYKGFLKNGFETYLLCQENVLGQMAKEIDKDRLFVFDNNREKFLNFIEDKKINILHYHYNTFCMEEMHEHNVRTIYTMHNVYAWKDDSELLEYAKILSTCDKVIPVSNFVKNYFNKRTHGICKNLSTIYNGIDFDELKLEELAPNTTREALGLKKSDIVFAFIASFYPVKGQCGMIGVMEKLHKIAPEIKLLLVGNIGDPCYYDKFKELIQDSSAKDSIILIPYFPHRSMGAFLRHTADAFILPTLQEGCSNAVLEAVYCDCPVLMTDIGNSAEMKKLKSCIVVNPPYEDLTRMTNTDIILTACKKDMCNQDELVNAMCEMSQKIDQYKAAARISEIEKEEYSTEKMVQSYIDTICQVNSGDA